MNRTTEIAPDRGLIVVMIETTGLIRLDFGEHGFIDVPPAEALRFVSSQRIRDQIRMEVHRARNEITRKSDYPSELQAARSDMISAI